MDKTTNIEKISGNLKEKAPLNGTKRPYGIGTNSLAEGPIIIRKRTPIGCNHKDNLIKLQLNKAAINLKTMHAPNGNLIVRGSNNKLVSVQVKNQFSPRSSASSDVSILPLKTPQGTKVAGKLQALSLMGSQFKKNNVNDAIALKANYTTPAILKRKEIKSGNTMTTNTANSNNSRSLITVCKTPFVSNKIKDTSNSQCITPTTSTDSNNSLLLSPMKPKESISLIKPLLPAKKKNISSNNLVPTNASPNSKSVLLATKLKQTISENDTSQSKDSLEIQSSSLNSTSNVAIPNTSISTDYKEFLPNNFFSNCLASTIFSSKHIEIKPIIVKNPQKEFSPAQAATVPVSLSSISPNIGFLKNVSAKSQNTEIVPIFENKKIRGTASICLNKEMIQTSANSSLINKQTLLVSKTKSAMSPNIVKLPLQNESDLQIQKPEEKNEQNVDLKNCEEGVIRVRSLESLTQSNNKPQIKQQSLLKCKAIEKLKRSPRTDVRSKSLNLATAKRYTSRNKKIPRRLSTSSDSNIKKDPKISLCESLLNAISDAPSKKDSLLCDENVDVLPPATANQESNESLASSNYSLGTLELINKSVNCEVAINEPENILRNGATLQVKEKKSRKHIESLKMKSEGCNLSFLSWKDGIGYIPGSNLRFQLNDLDLIEVAEQKGKPGRSQYDLPIYEREYKSQKTADYCDPLFYCKGCKCHGAAVDFLVPDFCSHECIKRFDTRSVKTAAVRKKKDEIYLKPPAMTSKNIQKYAFEWTAYLESCTAEPAPIDLFPNPLPCGPNLFKLGMKLEAIDPEHSNLFCVCTVVETKGYRIKLHFDGYSKKYDFWTNCDSMDIFPPGWCTKTNRRLQAPKGMNSFSWPKYLTTSKADVAPRKLFTHLNSSSTVNPFQVHMKLEADDLKNTRKVCVASVADVLDNRILVHFDGWDESYDYWIDISSPFIHPINWHKQNGFSIVPPPDFKNNFNWKSYLVETKCKPATQELFSTRDPIPFQPGMKLEVVDKKNPSLIRPATVLMRDDYEIKVLFDGWSDAYSFWVLDDSPDIHPVGWCEATSHELEPPPNFEQLTTKMPCPISGCRGFGNVRRPEIDFHVSLDACPYEIHNWNADIDINDRLKEKLEYMPQDATKNSKRQAEELHRNPKKYRKSDLAINPYYQNNEQIKQDDRDQLNVSHKLLCDYGPRLKQVRRLWKKNSECLTKDLSVSIIKDPLTWTVSDVVHYIEKLPRCQFASSHFREQDIDGIALLSMRQSDLVDILHIKLGPAIKIYNQIVQLREEVITKFT